ncbi:MAG: glycosyltransferase family 4 protein [Candidatus Firestonebacteria bacterium]
MKKILHIVTRLEYGGTLENILTLVNGLSIDYENILLLGRKNTAMLRVKECSNKNNFKVIYINELVREINPFYDLKALLKIYKIVKKISPDIVHTHTSKSGFLGRIAARMAGCRKVVHTPHGHIFYGYFGEFKTFIFVLLERIMAKVTDKIVVFSKSEIKDHLRLKIGKKKQFIVIPNGININKFEKVKINVNLKKKELGINMNDKVIGVIGRLSVVKGHIYFLKAMRDVIKAIRYVKVIVAGSGELEKELKQNANDLNLQDNVLFIGNRNDVPEILKICDLVVLPSLNEGFGLAIAEAGAAGKPVVATRVGGIPEIIKENETGLLVNPKNVVNLSRKIIYCLKNPAMANKMGFAGRKHIKDNFTTKIMIKRYRNLYENI